MTTENFRKNMDNSILLKKIEMLPKNIQSDIIDLIDVLLRKYQDEENLIINDGLNEDEKQELVKRHSKMKKIRKRVFQSLNSKGKS